MMGTLERQHHLIKVNNNRLVNKGYPSMIQYVMNERLDFWQQWRSYECQLLSALLVKDSNNLISLLLFQFRTENATVYVWCHNNS